MLIWGPKMLHLHHFGQASIFLEKGSRQFSESFYPNFMPKIRKMSQSYIKSVKNGLTDGRMEFVGPSGRAGGSINLKKMRTETAVSDLHENLNNIFH